MKKLMLALFLLAAAARPASALVILDTYPNWDGNFTGGWAAIAQSFRAPSAKPLSSWQFQIGAGAGTANLLFSIYAWDDSVGTVGPALFSTSVAWPAGGGDVLVNGIDLLLTPGALYAAVVDVQGDGGSTVAFMFNNLGYPDGNASWFDGSNWQFLNSGWSTRFTAVFVPEPAAAALLALGALAVARRARR